MRLNNQYGSTANGDSLTIVNGDFEITSAVDPDVGWVLESSGTGHTLADFLSGNGAGVPCWGANTAGTYMGNDNNTIVVRSNEFVVTTLSSFVHILYAGGVGEDVDVQIGVDLQNDGDIDLPIFNVLNTADASGFIINTSGLEGQVGSIRLIDN